MPVFGRVSLCQLTNGVLVQVPPTLIKRSKAHLRAMNIGVDLIIGTNGEIWVTPLSHVRTEFDEEDPMDIDDAVRPLPHFLTPIGAEMMRFIRSASLRILWWA